MKSAILGLSIVLAGLSLAIRQKQSGALQEPEKVYEQHCATCHEGGNPRAVSRAAMKKMGSENIRFALTKGSMKAQGDSLIAQQVDDLIKFLASSPQSPAATVNYCDARSDVPASSRKETRWDGWGNGLEQHRFQSAAMSQISADQLGRLKPKWAFGFPDVSRMYGQPAVMHERLFVGSAARKVYSLDAATGCLYWQFAADYPVRTAISFGEDDKSWTIYFGDQHGFAYAVDASTGKLLWKTRVDDHPATIITGAPVLAEGKLFVPASSYEEALAANPQYECCKFRGSLTAIEAATGKVLWKSYTIAEPPQPTHKSPQGAQLWGPSGVAVWSAPTVDLEKHRVYVTTGVGYSQPVAGTSDAFLAFDMKDGKLLWTRQITAGDAYTLGCALPAGTRVNCLDPPGPDADFGSSPILVRLKGGRRVLVAGQKSGVVHAVDPDHEGKILWQTRIGHGGVLGGVQWGSAVEGDKVFVALSDVAIRPATENTVGAQKSITGGLLQLDPNAGGGLFALDLSTGKIVWHTPHPGCQNRPGCSPAQSAAVTATPGMIFSGGLDGHMRTYSSADGTILWDVNTEHDFQTVNGVAANGGSIDGPGPVVVGGMVYITSGYGYLGHTPGNVLIAYSVDGK